MNLTHLERQLLRHIGLGKPVNHSYHFGVLTYRSGAEVELASAIQCDGITLWEGRFYVGELAKQRLGGYMHPGENIDGWTLTEKGKAVAMEMIGA
jgi:hypothetical protein